MDTCSLPFGTAIAASADPISSVAPFPKYNIERMRRECEAYADASATVEQLNDRLAAKKSAWFWPTIAAALTSKRRWLVIACDSCDTVIDLDKRRDRNTPIRIALDNIVVHADFLGSMETSIFVTDLAQQFSLSVVGPSHPVVVPLRVARAGRRGFS